MLRFPLIPCLLRGLVLLLLATVVSSCYWSDEEKAVFDHRHREFCERIDSLVAMGERDALSLLRTSPERANELFFNYLRTARNLRSVKDEAVLAFMKCEGGKLEAVFKQLLELLREGVHDLPQARSLLALASLVAQQYNIRMDGVASQAMGSPEGALRFDFTPQEGLALEREDGSLLSRYGASGVLTASLSRHHLELLLLVKSFRLDIPLNLPNESILAVEELGDGFVLGLEPNGDVFPDGWKGTFVGELNVIYLSFAGDAAPAEKPEPMRLDFYFDGNFKSCSISTLGSLPAADLFPVAEKPDSSRLWAFYPNSNDMIVDRETVFTIEHGPPNALIELYLSTGLAEGLVLYDGVPWRLDVAHQVLVRTVRLDDQGLGTMTHVPGPTHSGQVVFFQALARGSSAVMSSGVQVGRIRVELRRGDTNADGKVSLSDAVSGFGYLFQGARKPGCEQAADANASGRIDISDSVYLLHWLFHGGQEPPSPGPEICGIVPAGSGLGEELPCGEYAPCGRQ